MKRYILRRIAGLVPLFFGVTFLTFCVVRLSPGEPAALESGSVLHLTAQAHDRMQKLYGLDQPLIVQYGHWVGRLVRLDFGNSFTDNEPAVRKIGRALPITIGLNLVTLALAFVLGAWLGLVGAVRAGSRLDRILSTLCFAVLSVPAFWLALLLIFLFGVHWRILPITGLQTLFAEERPFLWRLGDLSRHLVLPIFAAAFGMIAAVSRYARAAFLDVIGQPFVRNARSAGVPESQIQTHLVLRNGLLPLVTLLGLSLPAIVGGSVIFESVFSIPGMGRLFYQAVFQRDYPVILGILVIGSVLTMVGNLLADFACALADPRVRSEISS